MIIAINGYIGHGKDTLGKIFQYEFYRRKFEPSSFNKIPVDLDFWLTATDSQKNQYRENLSGLKVVKFADKLKDMCCILLGCTRMQLEDPEFKNSVLGPEWNRTTKDVFKWIDKNTRLTETLIETVSWDFKDFAIGRGFKYERTVREFMQELGTDVLRSWIGDIHVNATFASYKPVRRMPNNKMSFAELQGTNTPAYPDWVITDMRFPNEAGAVVKAGGLDINILDPRKPVPADQHESETALNDWKFTGRVINDGTFEDLHYKVIELVDKYKLH